jgi:hypothetical protein
MKKFLHTLFCTFSFLLILIALPSDLKAQKSDTTLFDYDDVNSCFACGDALMYNVAGTKDSFIDNTNAKEYLYSLTVKYKMFSCYSNSPLTLLLNGNSVGTINSKNNCSCNACDSLQFDISAANIAAFYKYGQKKCFSINLKSWWGFIF